ncbi:alpha/beta hydrolase [Arthrobacter sp. 35W]|uniref:alpha/beta hydrolase n=1 Tax=Arthrobacter sp. 35W TaxID=1132441 RepID=UPI0004250BD8|nr:alpha/beta hydrolase [Arthrobacter sp. 35W]
MNAARTIRRRPRALAAAAASVVAALLLSSCSVLFPPAVTGPAVTSAAPGVIGDVPAALESFYSQPVTWTNCEENFQCATVKVPMDYANPASDTISLAAIRLPSTGTKQGSLLVNPGGPGASGYDMVKDGGQSYFSAKLRKAYDVVGFDPRGVQRSSPVQCVDDATRDRMRQESYDLDNSGDLARLTSENEAYAAECAKNTGAVMGFVDTVSSAKDMDILRAVVGDPKLNYMGFSYGTKLGATYAGLFPSKVGRFSLDGAMDPSLDIEDISRGQAKGFETAIHAWATNCMTHSDCPVSGTPDQAVEQIRELNAVYAGNPQRTRDGRLLTATEFTNAVAFAMYSTDLWDLLSAALTKAFAGDSSAMLALADYSADRGLDGKYGSNTAFAFNAINCLDYRMDMDPASMHADSLALQAAYPTFGKLLSYSGLTCAGWPYQPVDEPAKITADGAGPILVVGTTRDPATPYEWAVALSEQLSSGVLVTWDGDGHTAYGRANKCITDAVDGYFVDGTVPTDGLRC